MHKCSICQKEFYCHGDKQPKEERGCRREGKKCVCGKCHKYGSGKYCPNGKIEIKPWRIA